jgi:hypothetical protein
MTRLHFALTTLPWLWLRDRAFDPEGRHFLPAGPVSSNMRHMFQSIVLLSAFATNAGRGAPPPLRPVVYELYTSEGCSSCPPADLIVNELAQRTDVLALTFHVDYWDDLGWRDRYSLAEATERQRGYAHALRKSSVYTPQAVVDGMRDIVGSHRAAVTEALVGERVGVATSLSLDAGTVHLHLGEGSIQSPAADVLLVGYLRQATTHIGRGENSGRTLTESNIVRALRPLGASTGAPYDYQLKVGSLPAETTDVAVLIQSAGQGGILGSARQSIR